MLHSRVIMPEETFEALQPTQPLEHKPTNWTKVILAAVLGFALLTGAARAGYWYGTESARLKSQISKPIPVSQPTPTPSPTSTPEPTADWKTYTSESASFLYPQDWVAESPQVFGSRSEVDFKYNLTTVLALSMVGNYNNSTGEPFATLNEFLGNRDSNAKEINVGGYQAKRITSTGETGHVIPYEEVVLFTPDKSLIVSLYYQASYYEKPEANRVLDQILSTFKFL